MNLYEFEGKQLFAKHGIATPKGVVVRRGEDIRMKIGDLGFKDFVVKAQVLSGKRGKNNGIRFCSSVDEAVKACEELFANSLVIATPHPASLSRGERGSGGSGQYVAAVLVEEKLNIAEEHYLSITYDTNKKQPVMIYSVQGGMDIEDVDEKEIEKVWVDVRNETPTSVLPLIGRGNDGHTTQVLSPTRGETQRGVSALVQSLWNCFLAEDTRIVEINPLVKTTDGRWVAADAKVAIDDDAFYRHEEWKNLEPRTMLGRLPTEREMAVKKIDEGEKYYQGTAGKYIEMDGDIAMILNGGGASIANMDALMKVGLKPANYTEYSGNPPREKVCSLAKIVLSKPGLRGLWMAGVVANFTNVKETFLGIIDALDEIKPTYPIVVRRDGPESAEAMELMRECAERNSFNIKLFTKETSMSDTAGVLAEMVGENILVA